MNNHATNIKFNGGQGEQNNQYDAGLKVVMVVVVMMNTGSVVVASSKVVVDAWLFKTML